MECVSRIVPLRIVRGTETCSRDTKQIRRKLVLVNQWIRETLHGEKYGHRAFHHVLGNSWRRRRWSLLFCGISILLGSIR